MPRVPDRPKPKQAPPPRAPATPAPVQFVDGTHSAAADGPLDRVVRGFFAGASWNAVRGLIESGKVSVAGSVVRQPTHAVRAGTEIRIAMRAPRAREPELSSELVVHQDSHVIVVLKPPGISTVPYNDEETGTLAELVETRLRRGQRGPQSPLGVVHRLDKDTSGLIVFARTLAAKRGLKQQFRVHSVARRYLALAHGPVRTGTLHSRLVRDRGDGRRGSTDHPELGRDAITHVRVLEKLDGATLIECRLETGRTHQIRIHLAEEGYPLVGERVYTKGYTGRLISAPRLMLHAFELGFEHPVTGAPLHFEAPMPADFRDVLVSLRA
ncbi:MAG TPA: RluA family pseudouridine synthase [Polyangiaceae bacterium]|nr:RluA family pseudouridine synthase [Polyangiaceae bacterium]